MRPSVIEVATVPNVSPSELRVSPRAASSECQPSIIGIWRLGETLHESTTASLSLAQPADAAGSPRWDYVLKQSLRGGEAFDELEGRRQILRFIAAAAGVNHPNVVPVLDASTTATAPYLVMPRLEGESMQWHLGGDVPKPLPVALWLVRQVAQGLEALHASGWIHGDVKPANVIVGPSGHVTLVDLGFATRQHTLPNHHYRGTPAYSAPETLQGEIAAMPAMDIFSLGRVLWQWLTCTSQVSTASLEPVAELVEAMVHHEPEQRPSAGAVAKELLRLEIETLGKHIGPRGVRRAA